MTDEAHATVEPATVYRRPTGLIRERGRTHGSFKDNAMISQAIKKVFYATPGWGKMADTEREAMEQIALKVSRILSGKSERQHWEDIAGYAQLIVEDTP